MQEVMYTALATMQTYVTFSIFELCSLNIDQQSCELPS